MTNLNSFYLESGENTPKVALDAQKGLFEVSGRSLHDNASEFYQPVFDWIDKYSTRPNLVTNFIFKLEYFDDGGASEMILQMMKKLGNIAGALKVDILGHSKSISRLNFYAVLNHILK